jgi:hypothetical protein
LARGDAAFRAAALTGGKELHSNCGSCTKSRMQ